jgi:hypothetical protein
VNSEERFVAEQRRRAAVLGAFLLVLLIASALAVLLGGTSAPSVPAGAPPAPAPTGEQFGVNVNYVFNDRAAFAPSIDAQLSALRATGVTVARSDAFWEASEPERPIEGVDTYVWTFDDEVASSLAAHGLRWLPIIDYTAPWDETRPGEDHSPPAYDSGYAAYAGAFAARYGPGGAFWRAHPELPAEPVQTFEIWNEPDQPSFWLPQPNAGAYAELYTRARNAIDAADPSARVIVGGLTQPSTFLPAMLKARPLLRGHVDGVAIHPYAPTPAGVLATVRGARATLDALGMSSVPLYVTEFGWPSEPAGTDNWAPESVRPAYISRAFTALAHSYCGVAMTVLYTWITPEQNPAEREDWFGIQSPRGGVSPDVRALTDALRADAKRALRATACVG